MEVRATALATLVAAGCFSKPAAPIGTGDAGPPDVALSGGTRRLLTTKPVQGPLQQFPLLVSLPGDAHLGANASSKTRIAFATLDGELLPCEIVEYVAGTGALEAWVLVPELGTPYAFDLVYGDDLSVTGACAGRDVWTEFRGVWHFTDAVADVEVDSTVNQHDLMLAHGSVTTVPGRVGNAFFLNGDDGSSGDDTCVQDQPSLDLGVESFAYEIWVHPLQLVGEYDVAMFKGGKQAGQPGFALELGTSGWVAALRDQSDVDANFGDFAGFVQDPVARVGTWSHIGVVVDRAANNMRVFVDGVLEGSDPSLSVGSLSGPEPLCVGDRNQPSRAYVDEPRLHAVARPGAWFEAAYRNVNESDFVVIAPAP